MVTELADDTYKIVFPTRAAMQEWFIASEFDYITRDYITRDMFHMLAKMRNGITILALLD